MKRDWFLGLVVIGLVLTLITCTAKMAGAQDFDPLDDLQDDLAVAVQTLNRGDIFEYNGQIMVKLWGSHARCGNRVPGVLLYGSGRGLVQCLARDVDVVLVEGAP